MKVAAIGVVGLFLTGCTSAPDPRPELEEQVATVNATVQEMFDAVDAAALSDAEASGKGASCRSQSAHGVTYFAEMTVPIGPDLPAGFDAFTDQLTASGWEVSDAHEDVQVNPDTPNEVFTRDNVVLFVKTGAFKSGTKVYGEEDMTVVVQLDERCIPVEDGKYAKELTDEFSGTLFSKN